MGRFFTKVENSSFLACRVYFVFELMVFVFQLRILFLYFLFFHWSLFVFLSISFADNFVFDNLCCHGNLPHKPKGVRSYLGGMSWKHFMV